MDMKKMREVGNSFRRLYEQLVQLQVLRRKRTTPQVHARVPKYPTRWKWVVITFLNCYASYASADGPLIVLSPTIPPNSIIPGAGYDSSIHTGTITLIPENTNTRTTSLFWFFVPYSSTQYTSTIKVGTTTDGLTYGVAVPGLTPTTYGIRIDRSDVYLVPHGTWQIARKSVYQGSTTNLSVTGDFDASLPELCKITGGATPAKTNSGQICNPNTTSAYGYQTGSTLTTDMNLHFDVYAGSSPATGATNISWLGGYIQFNEYKTYPYNKPTSIITAGLTCTLDAGNGQFSFKDGVQPSTTVGKSVGAFTGTDLGITASCGGTNTTNPPITVPVSYVLSPSGGAVASQGKLTDPVNQPSFYMTFTRDGSSTCNASDPNVILLDGYTASKIADVPPGQTITNKQIPLGATLCTTGDTTQAPGTYNMMVTASIVSY
ncbi:hypothetical protein H8I91_21645 [Serratia fonticola]|uniref:hypothetical protein n=1 Tax=Serratia fonticola TaxID=47917 RepID=UPI0016459F13|nr:hypothetical protein [Serratia fonticola]MBC3252872.1 hypothetical protein [Serratia fonticola]